MHFDNHTQLHAENLHLDPALHTLSTQYFPSLHGANLHGLKSPADTWATKIFYLYVHNGGNGYVIFSSL